MCCRAPELTAGAGQLLQGSTLGARSNMAQRTWTRASLLASAVRRMASTASSRMRLPTRGSRNLSSLLVARPAPLPRPPLPARALLPLASLPLAAPSAALRARQAHAQLVPPSKRAGRPSACTGDAGLRGPTVHRGRTGAHSVPAHPRLAARPALPGLRRLLLPEHQRRAAQQGRAQGTPGPWTTCRRPAAAGPAPAAGAAACGPPSRPDHLGIPATRRRRKLAAGNICQGWLASHLGPATPARPCLHDDPAGISHSPGRDACLSSARHHRPSSR